MLIRRRIKRLIAFASVLASLLLITSTFAPEGIATPAAAIATTHNYLPDDISVFPNPERGFETDIQDFQSLDPKRLDQFLKRSEPDLTLVHGSVNLSPYVTRNVDKPLLDGLVTAFALLRSHGLKAVMRFTYSPSLKPHTQTACDRNAPVPPPQGNNPPVPPDASLSMVTEQLQTLAPVLRANSDVIASFEAGFAGEFGEWHCSTSQLLSTKNNTIGQLVAAIMANFPTNRKVALRYPSDAVPFSAHPAYGNRVGNHQDCYAASPDDENTWSQNPATMLDQMAQIGVIGSHSVIGGTACALDTTVPSRTTCRVAVIGTSGVKPAELPEMHFSYLLTPYAQQALAAYSTSPVDPANVNCLNPVGPGLSIQRQLGYRLQLKNATFPNAVVAGRPFNVSVTLSNSGFAAPYNERPVYLVLDGVRGRTNIPVNADPRTWQTGQSVTISATVSVPTTATGSYKLSLWLPDASTSLQGGPTVGAYSIRLANQTVWDPTTGTNVLAANLPVSTAAGPSPASGSSAGQAAGNTTGPSPISPGLATTGPQRTTPLLAAGLATILTGALLVTAARRRPRSPRQR